MRKELITTMFSFLASLGTSRVFLQSSESRSTDPGAPDSSRPAHYPWLICLLRLSLS